MATTHYRQCELEQRIPGGFRRYVAWLPAQLVRIGWNVTIDGVPGTWLVRSAGDPRPASIVEAYGSNAHRGLPSGGDGRD